MTSTSLEKTDVFLSYGRGDNDDGSATSFVARLHRDLTTHGYSVWWDKVCMPTRALTFLQEIRDAINNTRRLILIIGPAGMASDYVRAEWEYAFAICKPILPILRVGDYKDKLLIPKKLKNLNILDFRNADNYEKQLEYLLQQLQEPVKELGVLAGVPSLPNHYLPRISYQEALSETVLADVNNPVVITSEKQTSALQGMGGIGKTVVATAFARACETRRAFVDGIVWITVGQKPSLRDLFQQVAHSLGNSDYNYPDADTGKQSLQRLIRNKIGLLILDDVWEVEHVRPFRDVIAQTRCRLLVTTRNRNISSQLGANEHQVDLFSPEQAIAFLREWSGRREEAFATIGEAVGYLPLALNLAGSQLSKGLSGAEWLEKYNRVSRMRDGRKPKNRDESLEISIEMGVNAALESDHEKALYYAFGIFRSAAKIPQGLVIQLWQQMNPDLEVFSCEEILDELKKYALINQDDKVITLHDLLHDYAQEKLGERSAQTHRDLLACYRAKGKPWHIIPNDGYLYDNLAYHLGEAGEYTALKALFDDQEWMRVRFEQRQYTYDGYVDDLDRIWKHCEELVYAQIEAGQEPTHFSDCFRYALIRTSINSLSANYLQGIIARAIELDMWTPERAFSMATRIADIETRVNMYRTLYETEKLAKDNRTEFAHPALQATLSLADEGHRVSMLSALAPHLTGDLLSQALEAAVDISDEYERALALRGLAAHLTEDLLLRAVKVALSLDYEGNCAGVLSALVPRLPEDLLTQVFQTALSFHDESYRVGVLSALVPHLTEDLLPQALEAALILDRGDCVSVLRDLAPRLPDDLLHQALEAALNSSDNFSRMDMVRVLAPHFSERLLSEALEAALVDKSDRVGMLSALALHLTEEDRQRALSHVLRPALSFSSNFFRARALENLAPYLTEDLLHQALQAALDISSEPERVRALESLVPHLTKDLLPQALEAAFKITSSFARASVLSALVAYLSEEDRQRALHQALQATLNVLNTPNVPSNSAGASFLERLAPHLTVELLAQALEAAFKITAENDRIRMLSILGPHLPESLLPQALETALNIERIKLPAGASKIFPASVVGTLAAYLSEDLLTQALQAVLDIPNEENRVRALGGLAPHLSVNLLTQVIALSLTISDEVYRVRALGGLVPYLSDEERQHMLRRALEIALNISSKHDRVFALSDLYYLLSENDRQHALPRALEAALNISDELSRWLSLRVLAPCLSDDLLLRALEAALAFSDEFLRASALESLAPYLPKDLLPRSVNVALAFSSPYNRVLVMSALVPRLGEENRQHVLPWALKVARQIPDEIYRGLALSALAPHLTEDLLPQALEAALQTPDDINHVIILSALAPRLPVEESRHALSHGLEVTLNIADERNRARALESLAPHLPEGLLPQALRVALNIADEGDRVRALSALAPHLDDDMLQQALTAALNIADELSRACILNVFLQLLPTKERALVREINIAMMAHLRRIENEERRGVLNFCRDNNLFAPPILSSTTLSEIANHVWEISEEWTWL